MFWWLLLLTELCAILFRLDMGDSFMMQPDAILQWPIDKDLKVEPKTNNLTEDKILHRCMQCTQTSISDTPNT